MLAAKLIEMLYLKDRACNHNYTTSLSTGPFPSKAPFSSLFLFISFWGQTKILNPTSPTAGSMFVDVLPRPMYKISSRSRVCWTSWKIEQATSHAIAKLRMPRKAARIINKICCKAAKMNWFKWKDTLGDVCLRQEDPGSPWVQITTSDEPLLSWGQKPRHPPLPLFGLTPWKV